MTKQKKDFKSEKEFQEAILQDKAAGLSDIEIGERYGVTYRYIERLITRTKGINISSLNVPKKIKSLFPKDFKEEQTTVWSFKQRGNWATHSGEYRGNWSPYIPRNIILKYSKPGELVLDYFCGAGTTAVEAKLSGRRCIAFDINEKAIELAKLNLNFNIERQQLAFINDKVYPDIYEPELSVGDARDLSFLQDNSIDLICSHPPYANIIQYTDSKEGDLSFFHIDNFLKEMTRVAKESFRVLKPGRQCAILIGDMRKSKHVIPMGFKLINVYLDAGFKLRELIIKRQHNCKTTGFWYNNSLKYNFLLLGHEYLPIFEKSVLTTLSGIRERAVYYGLLAPVLEKPRLKRKLDGLETTTVWIFPEKDFEERLNKNVINRYSVGKEHVTMSFVSHSNNITNLIERKGQKSDKLLFIKSPFLSNNLNYSDIESYIHTIEEIVNQELSISDKEGFIVIQTQDVRIDGYLEPMAKKLVDMLKVDNLWLKEIIVVVCQGQNSNAQISADYLKKVHEYLLVYELTG